MRFAALLVSTAIVIGCSQPAPNAAPPQGDGHGHSHDVPITKADVKLPATFEELVSRIAQYDREIATAIAAGKPASAHRALDELDIVLNETMTLAKNGVPEDQWGVVNESRQTIRNAFLEIHQSIDANEKPDYAAKEEAIQAAIVRLKQSAAPTTRNDMP